MNQQSTAKAYERFNAPNAIHNFAGILTRLNGQTRHHPFWIHGLNLDDNQVNYIYQYLFQKLHSLNYFSGVGNQLQHFVTIQKIITTAIGQMCVNTEHSPWLNNFSPNICLRFCHLVLAKEQIQIENPAFHWSNGTIYPLGIEHKYNYWN